MFGIFTIASFFFVSFSDPGFLVRDLKLTIDENLIKSLEEVKKNFLIFFINKIKFKKFMNS